MKKLKKIKNFLFVIIVCFISLSANAQITYSNQEHFVGNISALRSDGEYQMSEIKLEAEDIETNAQLINLVLDANRGEIRLNDLELIEDDAPATGRPEGYTSYVNGKVAWVEDLKKGIVIKKVLNIDNPVAAAARVVFKGMEVKGNDEPLYISINDETLVREASIIAYPHARQYIDMNWDRWFYVELPVDKLKKGDNEIKLWTESDSTSWRILIAHEDEFKRGSIIRTTHPNRSMKSSDGGKSWSDSSLGAMNSIDGEYSIRLSLDRHVNSGTYISPLIDLVNGDSPLKKNINNLQVSIAADVIVPQSSEVQLFVRFGANPLIGDQTWTDWKPLEEGIHYDLTDKHYLQWRAELTTSDPLFSPKIRGLWFSSVWENISPEQHSGLRAHVINNGEIIQTSYPFTYENLDHQELLKYRKTHKLDQIVEGATSEFEVMMRLLNWAYRVPLTLHPYSWNWNDVTVPPVLSEETGLPILNGPFFEGRRMVGMCLYPNQALIGALLSMGFQARHINIHSDATVGHEVTEVWSNQFNKWIYMDATRDYYYYDEKSGEPLNQLEIHNMLAEQVGRVETWQYPFASSIGDDVISKIKIGMRQGSNPFSIEEGGGRYLLKTMGHFRIIPRNDFLSNPLPVPVHTGVTMWGWDGFLNWYDDVFPKRYEYQQYTNRVVDFYQPLNQAEIFLAETNEVGSLNVYVKNFTPGGFDAILTCVDNAEWQERNEVNWVWALQPGLNDIKVRTKNVRGVLGPISHIQVLYNP